MNIRQANILDSTFLIEAIVEAEKSGSDIWSFTKIFDMDSSAMKALVQSILEEDITGQQLCISDFAVAEMDGKCVAAACAWIENPSGPASSFVTGSLLGNFVPEQNYEKAAHARSLMNSIHIERTRGALQFESVYTHPSYRGKGIMKNIFNWHASRAKKQNPNLEWAELITSGNNHSALNAYHKMGFSLVRSIQGPEDLKNYLPDNERKLLRSSIHPFLR